MVCEQKDLAQVPETEAAKDDGFRMDPLWWSAQTEACRKGLLARFEPGTPMWAAMASAEAERQARLREKRERHDAELIRLVVPRFAIWRELQRRSDRGAACRPMVRARSSRRPRAAAGSRPLAACASGSSGGRPAGRPGADEPHPAHALAATLFDRAVMAR